MFSILQRFAAFTLTMTFLFALPASSAQGNDGFMQFQIPPWVGGQSDAHSAAQESDDERPQRIRKTPQKKAAAMKPLTPDDYALLMAQQMPLPTSAIREDSPSPIEEMYSRRILDPIRQFGYDLFGTPGAAQTNAAEQSLPAGAVQDHFVLGIGDKLNVVFRGQRRDQGIYSITSDGLLVINDLPPVPAAGRTIEQVRQALEMNASEMYNTSVHVALESVRQVNVLVAGHVRKPGRKNLTVFHTVLDALMQSEGVQKTGSLRQIRLVRDGRSHVIDLYGLMVYGNAGMDLTLRDGDRIMVPPTGPTVAITGGVKRPGIFELRPALRGMHHRPEDSGEKLSLQEALDLAGGLLSPGNNRFIRLEMTNDGRERTDELDAPFAPALGDGSILVVERANEKRTETVELAGHTRQPGIHALAKAGSLSALLSDPRVLGPDIYPLIGVIERHNSRTLTTQMIDFPPNLVIAGAFDRRLEDGDTVILFSRADIIALQEDGKKTDGSEESGSNDETFVMNESLRSFLKERSAFIRGAIRTPGAWPVSDGATLESLNAVAGGLTFEANTSGIEVTSNLHGTGHQQDGRSGTTRQTIDYRETDPATVAIAAGDAVRVNRKFKKTEGHSVLITGEVVNPGRYDLLPGDTLAKLIERAGSLSDHAYPHGAIFSREADRRAEEARFRAAARELERAVAAASEKKDNPPDTDQIAMARDLANELRDVEAVGRITVQADPSVLKVSPEQDILLEPGDRVYIPRRPMTVRVHGEVLSPANLQFRSTKDPRDYIAEAGGMTYYADDDRTFVLYPDGSAQPLMVSAWNHKATFIPPGSTIVVPRDPKPFDFLTSARDFTQILSNLAITGIFLDDLGNDD